MRKFYLTTSVIATLLLCACEENSQNDIDASVPAETAAALELETQSKAPSETQDKTSSQTGVAATSQTGLPGRYQNLDPRDISRAEIDELIRLNREQNELNKPYQAELNKWRAQDPAVRGEWPKKTLSPQAKKINLRIQELKGKVRMAQVRKKYENFDSSVLSKSEIQELIALEQEQIKNGIETELKLKTWREQDPSTRGPQPSMVDLLPQPNPRLTELQGKIRGAEEIKRIQDRVKSLGEAHNIAFSDSELGELSTLEVEGQRLQDEMSKAMMDAQKNRQFGNVDDIQSDPFNFLPKHIVQRMVEIEKRKEAIKSPLEAAEQAERIRKNMTQLSAESGVTVLSGELEEAIALNAEKERITKKTQYDAVDKWLNEGGPIITAEPLPNDEDYARLKEIDARLKAISAPMTDAKNAALEADNPLLRQQRLQQEAKQKWATDWQDKKQAGVIPSDTPITYPTYAQLEDNVKDYRAKLKTRADKVGYTVSDADLERLEALNAQKLAIRKQVYDMEVSGTSRLKYGNRQFKAPAFGNEAGMYKIRLIEAQQSKILAGLTTAETPNIGSPVGGQSETGTQQFNRQNFSEIEQTFDGVRRTGAEYIIQSARERGQEISQSDIDNLRAFEREMKGE